MQPIAARPALRLAIVAAAALTLAACQSARFGPTAPRVATGVIPSGPGPVVTPLEPGLAAPTGVVTAEPLAPPPGTPGMPTTGIAASGQIIADAPTTGPRVAALPSPAAAPTPTRPTRTAFVGTWRASEPGGASCRVTLSSTPSLDLYRASTSGCANEDLSRVSAWDLRNDEIYLYRQGGAVAARLRASTGSMQGVLSRSGAPLALAR